MEIPEFKDASLELEDYVFDALRSAVNSNAFIHWEIHTPLANVHPRVERMFVPIANCMLDSDARLLELRQFMHSLQWFRSFLIHFVVTRSYASQRLYDHGASQAITPRDAILHCFGVKDMSDLFYMASL